MTILNSANAQYSFFLKVKNFEYQLDDVMELIEIPVLKSKLKKVEEDYREYPNEINKARLGIIYHETALNLTFYSKTEYKGYAKKGYDILTEMYNAAGTTKELMPFIASFRASSLSLVGAETKKLHFVVEAFTLFNEAVAQYADISYLPEFLRGSVAENLPWFFFSKRKLAKQDFQSIISRQQKNTMYANDKIMSFTYWAWAKQRQGKKNRAQALIYLDEAIALDLHYKGGRAKAEDLKKKLMK